MPILQCEFWNVGQGLFSSGRIQMGDAPVFHSVYDYKFSIMVQCQC